MAAVVMAFPGQRMANPAIARLACEEGCAAPACIFVPVAMGGVVPVVPVVRAFCGPACAAAGQVEPWRSVPAAERGAWGQA